MSRRSVGVGFCFIAALLYVARHFGSLMIAQRVDNWGEAYDFALRDVGTPLLLLSIVALLVGLAYLVWAEYEDYRDRDRRP